jgi:putative membrane protein
MLSAVWKKNDKKARVIIFTFSAIVFAAVMLLSRVKWNVDLGFDVHLFATANAIINSTVAILLIVALIAVKSKIYKLHRNIMLTAMFLSVLFLVQENQGLVM